MEEAARGVRAQDASKRVTTPWCMVSITRASMPAARSSRLHDESSSTRTANHERERWRTEKERKTWKKTERQR